MCRDIVISADALIIDVAQVGGMTHPSTHLPPSRSSGCAFCVCFLRRSFACCLRVPFCVDLTPHIPHAPHTTHHAPHAPHAPRTTHHTYTHANLEASTERATGGSWPRGFSSPSRSRCLQEGLDIDDLYVQGHPAPGHALEAPLPPRPGAGARHVALCRGSVSTTSRPASRSGTCRGQTTSGSSTRPAGRATGRTTPP